VDASGTGFTAAFQGVFSQAFLQPTNPNPIVTVLSPVVTAVSTNQQAGGSQVVTLAALTLRSGERKPVVPYLTLGAGIRSNRGPDSTVTLVGRYQFAFQLLGQGPLVPVDETDSLTIRYSDRGTSPVGVVGAGFRHYLTRASGVRVDGQLLMGVSQLTVSIDAAPSHVVGSPAGTLAIESTSSHPALQFSTSPAFQSSLSAGLKGFETFTGGGFHLQASITIGYFFGF
jgi:hypothetical protein